MLFIIAFITATDTIFRAPITEASGGSDTNLEYTINIINIALAVLAILITVITISFWYYEYKQNKRISKNELILNKILADEEWSNSIKERATLHIIYPMQEVLTGDINKIIKNSKFKAENCSFCGVEPAKLNTISTRAQFLIIDDKMDLFNKSTSVNDAIIEILKKEEHRTLYILYFGNAIIKEKRENINTSQNLATFYSNLNSLIKVRDILFNK